MATAVDRELAAAREPIPVSRGNDSVSKGLESALDRSADRSTSRSAPKATNNFTTSKFTTSGGGQEGWDLPGLALSGIQTWLKLRTRYQVQPRLTADLGLDLNPQSRAVKPVAALTYQLRREDVDWAALRITHQRAVLVKSWDVHLDRAKLPVSFSLNAAAGLTWQGRPDFDVNVGDLKPNWLVGVAAVAMLALRQPLTGVKTFGDTRFTDPFNGVAKGEVKTKAHRKGDGFEIGVSQLNAVLRF
jgi:hypothetical protein